MAKPKSFSASPLNPFDKSQGAAALFMPPPAPQTPVANVEQQNQQEQQSNNNKDSSINKETSNINYVANVEQQKQHNQQQNNNEDITTVAENADVDTVDGIEQLPKKKAKTPKRAFPGRQHLHLIVPEQMAADIKQLAKIRNVSVNVFVQEVLETALIEYKPVLKQLTLMNQKLGMNTRIEKSNKIL